MTPFLAPMFDFQPGTQIQRDTNAANRTRDFAKDFGTGWTWSNEVDVVALANAIIHPKNKPDNNQPNITDRKEAARFILQQAEPYSAVLDELRRASERPYARFNIAYDIDDKVSMLLPHLYMMRNTTRLLAARTAAELALGQTDQALADTKLGLYLAETIKAEPTIVSQLVRHACLRVTISVVNTGLREHQWNDPELQQIEAALEKIDLIAGMKLGLDAESKMHGVLLEDLKHTANRLKVINHWGALINPNSSESRNPVLEFLFWVAVPRGWIDFEQLNSRRDYLDKVNTAFDTQTQSLDPKVAKEVDKDGERLATNGLMEIILKHKVILKAAMPIFGKLATKTTLAQAEVKMTQIACALERYRLAHKQYPDELGALAQQFTSALPNDPINGGHFVYHRTGDAFLLYSIGWNMTDDGGKTVMTTGKFPHGDANLGDWVWGSSVSF
jgi:hypothetical protein